QSRRCHKLQRRLHWLRHSPALLSFERLRAANDVLLRPERAGVSGRNYPNHGVELGKQMKQIIPLGGVRKKRSPLFRWLRALFALFLVLAALVYFVYVLPFWGIPFNQSRHGRVPLTPPW